MREPDFIIEQGGGTYLRRWWLIPRNRFFNVYLHQFLKSDDDRALHDHPWLFNVSVLLKGSYREHKSDGRIKRRYRFLPYLRLGRAPHRVELDPIWAWGAKQPSGLAPVWTLFITGPVVREWGFLCPQGWKHWKDFVSEFGGGNGIGPGCADPVSNNEPGWGVPCDPHKSDLQPGCIPDLDAHTAACCRRRGIAVPDNEPGRDAP